METKVNSLEMPSKTNPVLERVKQVRAAQGEPVRIEPVSSKFSDANFDDTIHWVKY